MAISGLTRTYDQSTGSREDLEDIIAMISPTDTPLFALLNRTPVTNSKHEWLEDTLRSMTSTLGAAMGGVRTSVSLTVQTGHGAARFPIAANYPMLLRIGEEMMLGTARTTNVLTVTRDYNSLGATAAHASGVTVEIIADAGLEGADARAAFAQSRTRPYNVTQVFDATIQISGTQEVMNKAGIPGNESDYQATQRLKELKIQIEKSLIMGTRVDGTASTYRSMGGFKHYITTNLTNRSDAAITEAMIEADARACFDAGGSPNMIVCNSFQADRITDIYKDRLRAEVEAVLGGALIERIRMPVAGMGELAIVVNRWVPQHEYYILDGTKLFLGQFRTLFERPMGNTGDANKSQVVGEYTTILKNESAHARSYSLATS